jgi:hypothetical protein
MCQMLLLLTQIVVLKQLRVFLQLSSIGLFEEKRAYLPLETPKLNEVFLSKLNLLLTAKRFATCCRLEQDDFLWRDTCVSST